MNECVKDIGEKQNLVSDVATMVFEKPVLFL